MQASGAGQGSGVWGQGSGVRGQGARGEGEGRGARGEGWRSVVGGSEAGSAVESVGGKAGIGAAVRVFSDPGRRGA